jgi:hypothetical protein
MAAAKTMAQRGASKANGSKRSPVPNTAGAKAASLVSALRIGNDDDVPKRRPKPKMKRKWISCRPAGSNRESKSPRRPQR